jgi:hypothetical protein
MLKYILLFLMQINAFSQTKIGPQELSQPFVIVSSNTKQQALVIDNDYNIGNGYNFVVSTMGYVGIGVLQPKAMLDINANPNQQYALVIDTNNNPSDGYVVSISTNGKLNAFGVIRVKINNSYTKPSGENKIPIDTLDFNTRPDVFIFDSSNNRIIVKINGYYFVSSGVAFNGNSGDNFVAIYKNGVKISQGTKTGSYYGGSTGSDIIYLNANDYVELWSYTYNNVSLQLDYPYNFISLLGPF